MQAKREESREARDDGLNAAELANQRKTQSLGIEMSGAKQGE